LIASADVVLENYRPGVMDRLGLGYEHAKALKQDIIYCSYSAYDPNGPARDRPGQDLLIQASCGIVSLTGRGDGPPIPVGAYIIDGFNAMQGVAGILAALRYRDQHGVGQRITSDMMSSSLFLMAQEASYVLNIDANPERSRNGIAHVNQSAPYGVYETKDGAIVLSTFGGVPMVRKLVTALGILEKVEPYLTEQGLRFQRDEVAQLIADVLAKLPSKEAIALIEPTGTWSVPVRSLAEALDDPAVAASGIVKTYETPYGGKYRVVTEGLKMSATPITTERPAPAHGEHSREVLADLGYAPARIEQMFTSGATFEYKPS
jgi:CoA:oxalate CoA-transferase